MCECFVSLCVYDMLCVFAIRSTTEMFLSHILSVYIFYTHVSVLSCVCVCVCVCVCMQLKVQLEYFYHRASAINNAFGTYEYGKCPRYPEVEKSNEVHIMPLNEST